MKEGKTARLYFPTDIIRMQDGVCLFEGGKVYEVPQGEVMKWIRRGATDQIPAEARTPAPAAAPVMEADEGAGTDADGLATEVSKGDSLPEESGKRKNRGSRKSN